MILTQMALQRGVVEAYTSKFAVLVNVENRAFWSDQYLKVNESHYINDKSGFSEK